MIPDSFYQPGKPERTVAKFKEFRHCLGEFLPDLRHPTTVTAKIPVFGHIRPDNNYLMPKLPQSIDNFFNMNILTVF